jgi:hypothetical protein
VCPGREQLIERAVHGARVTPEGREDQFDGRRHAPDALDDIAEPLDDRGTRGRVVVIDEVRDVRSQGGGEPLEFRGGHAQIKEPVEPDQRRRSVRRPAPEPAADGDPFADEHVAGERPASVRLEQRVRPGGQVALDGPVDRRRARGIGGPLDAHARRARGQRGELYVVVERQRVEPRGDAVPPGLGGSRRFWRRDRQRQVQFRVCRNAHRLAHAGHGTGSGP